MLERCYDRSERDLARLRMALERAAQLEGEANRKTCRREALERRVEILEEQNRANALMSLDSHKEKKPCSNGPNARSKK